jgi:hypothetical protein
MDRARNPEDVFGRTLWTLASGFEIHHTNGRVDMPISRYLTHRCKLTDCHRQIAVDDE